MLTDELDHTIVMHKEVHFGGSFDEMLAYYEDEDHLGILPEIDIDRILYLDAAEKKLGSSLAEYLLSDEELEKIERAKTAYGDFKKIYEMDGGPTTTKLLSDLILAEYDELDVALQHVVEAKEKTTSELLRLLTWDEGYDPLFPGYGYAPYFAILALGKIKDERAIIPLFETIGKEMVFEEESISDALFSIGKSAKHFLIKTLIGRPITGDNIHAAWALSRFVDKEIEQVALYELQNTSVWKHPRFFTYLLNLVEENKEKLVDLMKNPHLPLQLKKEIAQLL